MIKSKNISRRFPPLMQLGSALVLAVALFSVGCKKAKTPVAEGPAPTPAQVKQAEADHMPAPARPPAAPAVVAQPNAEPDLAELNRGLLRWMMGNRRRPKSFEDFAATAGVAIPPPPAGKKYIIASDMHIKLVSQ